MKMLNLRDLQKLLQPGINVKRWLLLLAFGLLILGIGFAQLYAYFITQDNIPTLVYYLTLGFLPDLWRASVAGIIGVCSVIIALYELNNSIVQPIFSQTGTPWIEVVTERSRLQKGLRVVVIGGGTGLPSVLRGLKAVTHNLTAVVTMADDGGSSGRLRREMGVPPPGDLRNNLAALSKDEDMMTRLFQYRFGEGELGGHSFGNLFLTALSNITGSMDTAVLEAGRVLAITGQVMPSTLHHVSLVADIRQPDGKLERVFGESKIPEIQGKIERVFLEPSNVQTLPEVKKAILNAELIVIGPGSLYTSILPNLLVKGIVEALRATSATVVYVCNIAEQPGETDGYSVAEHVEALETHIGRPAIIDYVLANNAYPAPRQNEPTCYVQPAPPQHPIHQNYHVVMADLTNAERPWRHDSDKLVLQLLRIKSAPEADPDKTLKSENAIR